MIVQGEVDDLRIDLGKEVQARAALSTFVDEKITMLEENRALKTELNTVKTELSAMQTLVNSLIAGGKHQSTPVRTCGNLPSDSSSGVYWIKPTSRPPFQVCLHTMTMQ